MSRVSYSAIATGRRKQSGNRNNNFEQVDIIQTMKYEMGDKKRWVLPIVDGSIVGFSTPIHNSKNGFVVLPKKAGGVYTTGKIRCMHPSAQMSEEEQIKIAKSDEMCLYCDIVKYEGRKQWDIIGTQHPDFKELDNKGKRAIFEEIQAQNTVESTFYNKTTEDGREELLTFNEMYLLVLELELDSSGNPVKENGIAKYQPILLPVSKKRIDKFKDAVENALDMEVIQPDYLEGYEEEDGEEKFIGWLDFTIKFPKKEQKMESGKDMSVNLTPPAKSEVTTALKEAFYTESDALIKRAEHTTSVFYRYLAPHTRAKAIETLANRVDENGNAISGAEYFAQLEEKYKILEDVVENGEVVRPSDDNRKAEIFNRILERAEKAETAEKTEKVEEPTAKEEVVAETSVEEPTQKTVKRVVKKKEAEKPVEKDEDFEGLLEF